LPTQIRSRERVRAIHAELARDIQRPADANALSAERWPHDAGRGRQGGFDFWSGGAHPRTSELTAKPCFLPTQFVFTPLPFGRLLFAFLPLLVRLHLVAAQYPAQVAFEAVLAIAQILTQILEALGVKHRRRAVAVIEFLVHLRDRADGAVALGPRRYHERVVRLSVATSLVIIESQERACERRIEWPGELHTGKLGGAWSIAARGTQGPPPVSALCSSGMW